MSPRRLLAVTALSLLAAAGGCAEATEVEGTGAPDAHADVHPGDGASDSGATVDSSEVDTSIADGAVDSSVDDTAVADSGAIDTSVVDSGAEDTAIADTGADSGAVDSGADDTGAVDSGADDTGAVDSGAVDSGADDTGAVDSGAVDSGADDTGAVDAGADTAPPPVVTYPPSGATGAACTSYLDCDDFFYGYCSNEIYSAGPLDPSPVCVSYGTSICTPSTDTTIQYCDAGNGLCLASGTDAFCAALCTFDAYGHMLRGCTGKNACVVDYFADVAGVGLEGVGECSGGCTVDSDCPSGSKCDPVQRLCFEACTSDTTCKSAWSTAPAIWGCDTTRGACTYKYPKSLGDACTSADDCPCFKGSTAASGYCVRSCRTGLTGDCPTGYTCDALLPATDTSGGTAFTAAPAGLSGYCTKNCTTAADCPTGQKCEASGGVAQKTCRP